MKANSTKSFWARNIQLVLSLADLLVIYLVIIGLDLALGISTISLGSRLKLIIATLAYIPVVYYLNRDKSLKRVILLDRVMRQSVNAIILHAVCFMALAAFIHLDISIQYYVFLYSALLVMFPVVGILCRYKLKQLRRRGMNTIKVAIVGTNSTARRLAEALLNDPGYGYRIVGFFDRECLPDFDGKYLGDYNVLAEYAKAHKIDEIYFTLVGEKADTMPRIVKIADDNMVQFFYVPKISMYVNGGFQLHNIGSMPILTLRRNPLNNSLNRGIKRSFDLVFSSLFLIVSPLIFIPVAVAIKASSPGPVFFKQLRTGYRGRSFYCYKFRTMRVNADADKAQATADDPRKTKIGDFLRRTSIDELPQFINVFLGDMSVVGPRPHMLKHTEDYTRLIDRYMVRHIVKPGITGWAQVCGYRGLTDELWKMEKRVEHDVWYIENWHFTLDLKIIVRTVMNAVQGEKNAF